MPIFYGGDSITPVIHLPPNVGSRSITANGTYYAVDSSLDGYSSVTVSVTGKFGALVDGSITTVTAEDLAGVTAIKNFAFWRQGNLTSLQIPDSVTTIGERACQHCTSLTNVTFGSGLTSIGYEAFASSGITSISIPNNVTTISSYAFGECSSLVSVIVGTGVTRIYTGAFRINHALASVVVMATTPPVIDNNVFYDTNNCPIFVPSGSVNTYKTASNWASYSSRIQAIPS